ncbi:unnamed protein product [Polarella glacialis]|uniref:Uncharacterized protein n=1 Tax=Polarella glacialis TaxID=89957 RepID=A0A813ILH2_POLGL|nr:unnamed protein product [Polarella glacialis]
MTLLGERLLGQEVEALSEVHRALVMRNVVLIYGAARMLAGDSDVENFNSEWWLLAVCGTRHYLQLSQCKVSTSPPEGLPVCCYRSYTAPKPQDPGRSRIFRWQVLLVQNPGSWTEDPLATEQKSRKAGSKSGSLTDAKVSAPTSSAKDDESKASSSAGFMLFGDFDIEELFDDFDSQDVSADASDVVSPGREEGAGAVAAAMEGDIDDFFDSLLAETLDESPSAGAESSSAPAFSKKSGTPSSGEVADAAPAAVKGAVEPSGEKAVAATAVTAVGGEPAVGVSPGPGLGTGSGTGSVGREPPAPEGPPLDAETETAEVSPVTSQPEKVSRAEAQSMKRSRVFERRPPLLSCRAKTARIEGMRSSSTDVGAPQNE